ncbi:MAG TPA: TerB family tellurite resistance protein [Candidatus Thermoplasmatota archaeon]|nr:TerB family tellurite resistance protein [Candidatus Thermoplasmatota archaeon]
MDTKDAIVGLLVGAMVSDGRVLHTELQTASLHLDGIEGVEITASDVRSRIERISRELANSGRDAFVDRCAGAIPPHARLPVLKAVIAVVECDDDIDGNEAEYVHALARRMGMALP